MPDLAVERASSRMRCITRASKSGANATTSPRNVAATRSITSSLSCTVNLPQLIPQSIARALHAHLERRDPDSSRGRDFFVAHIFDMLQQKRLALLHRQPLEGAADLLAPCNAFLGVILRGVAQRDLVVHDRALPPSAPRTRRAAPIDQNSKQPRSEPLRILAPGQ